jgi:hypothetical protein
MAITKNQLDVATLPAPDNAITVESGTAAGQGTLYDVLVLQVHGRYLDAIYPAAGSPITAQELTEAVQVPPSRADA